MDGSDADGMQFITVWRNKWTTAEAESPEEVVRMLRESANLFEEIVATGKVEVEFGSAGDDYLFMFTDDEEVAEKYGFSDNDSDDEDPEDCDRCAECDCELDPDDEDEEDD